MSWWRPGPYFVTCEHVIPKSRGGSDDWSNLVAACQACNVARDADIDAWVFEAFRRETVITGIWPAGADLTSDGTMALFQLRRTLVKERNRQASARRASSQRHIRKIRAQSAREERWDAWEAWQD
mgnify:CR=1 FL=1